MPHERIRAQPPTSVLESGRGIPPLFSHLINTPPGSDDETKRNDVDDELDTEWKFLQDISAQWKNQKNISAFNFFCREVLKLEEYEIDNTTYAGMPFDLGKDHGHDDDNDFKESTSGIDMGILDKYVQEIQLHREIIAQELLAINRNWELLADQAARLRSSIPRLARHTFHGNENAYQTAQSSIPMLTWILNKSKLPNDIHVLTIKSLSEMVYSSKVLKKKVSDFKELIAYYCSVPLTFAESKGAKLLLHCMREMPRNPEIACWAGYCLTMACINSPEMIQEAKKDSKLLDLVTEIAFDIYWFNWPVNYGLILQGIFFGPTPPHQRENFQFI